MTTIIRDPARRRRIKVTPLRILILIVLAAALVLGGGGWLLHHWAPSRERYPLQGVTVSAASGAIHWPSAKADGVDFVYLLASTGSERRDEAFSANLESLKGMGLRYGAIHRYSLCADPAAQATAFIATVPRDAAMLPPTVALDLRPGCPRRPSRDRLLADLNTFLNQIEIHSGKPAMLRISRDFEQAYDLSAGINRTLWLEGDFFVPGYATHGWVMWTASTWKRVRGIEGPVEWDVVRP